MSCRNKCFLESLENSTLNKLSEDILLHISSFLSEHQIYNLQLAFRREIKECVQTIEFDESYMDYMEQYDESEYKEEYDGEIIDDFSLFYDEDEHEYDFITYCPQN